MVLRGVRWLECRVVRPSGGWSVGWWGWLPPEVVGGGLGGLSGWRGGWAGLVAAALGVVEVGGVVRGFLMV
ncbi:hypothetical protein GCM10009634_05450 [Saccharothrix xinjiangensis]